MTKNFWGLNHFFKKGFYIMDNPMHYTIDFAKIDSTILSSPDEVYKLLVDLTAVIEMTPVGNPVVYQMFGDDPLDCGITGVQVLRESLIDIHTYTRERQAYISIFSCKPYDILKVINFLQDQFKSIMNFIYRVPRIKHLF